jgi:phosphoserine phosphatase RsbU/P
VKKFFPLALTFLLFASRELIPQTTVLAPQEIRYHFGDDPDGKLGWANPNFDDSSWPLAKDGQWPMPPFYSDGFIWIRFHVPVRGDASGPLALRSAPPFLDAVNAGYIATELYAGGVLVGKQGSLPTNLDLDFDHRDAVFDLPQSAATPGATAVVALRSWFSPASRRLTPSATSNISIDQSRVLHLAHRADQTTITYANLLDLELNVLFVLLGVGILVAWRWVGGRDLLVFGWLLILHSVYQLFLNPSLPGVGSISGRTLLLIQNALILPSMLTELEFLWTVFGLRANWVKRLWRSLIVIFVAALLIGFLATTPTATASWALRTWLPLFVSMSLIQVGVCLWELFVRRTNRLIAIAFIAISMAGWSGFLPFGLMVGPFYEHTLALTFYLSDVAIFLLLTQRAWKAWRARDELRVEFDAAREVQEQLVAPAHDLSGFKIESAYLPAKQVGGDFFRVLSGQDGSVLIVSGDVSGKGLKAAMNVSAIIGALRTMPVLTPAGILAALNRGLIGQMQGGFATCCVARIATDGTMIIANAGNPAPYCNGREMAVEPGLPLGMIADAAYAETRAHIAPGDQLTFVSDGVIEATSPTGELFGFDRTQSISTKSAQAIADAAQQWGQEDDITVLTVKALTVTLLALTREPA